MPRKPAKQTHPQPAALLDGVIHEIRGQKVMLDNDLAELYGVTTSAFNQAVKRNAERFPEDFRFQLSREEYEALKSRSVISSAHGGRRFLPWAFTEQGVAMLSGVLSSERAVAVNIEIMRAFVRMRSAVATNAKVLHRLGLVEAHVRRTAAQLGEHKAESDRALRVVFEALKQLANRPDERGDDEDRPPIGFDIG